MTRSIYQIPPGYKSNGKITRACTEKLFPQLAFMKTEMGIPTIRQTYRRFPLFSPGYINQTKKLISGVQNRFLKFGQTKKSLSIHHRTSNHQLTMKKILDSGPYAPWFKSADTMLTGEYYNADYINEMLTSARAGNCNKLITLGRVINQELLCRHVYGDSNVV